MTKAEIIALAENIGRVSIDADTIDVYFTDTLEEIGRFPKPPLVNVELQEVTSGTAEHAYPDDAVLPLHIFHGERHLSPETVANLEAYEDGWRALTGDPFAWTRDEKTTRTFELVPEPDSDSGDFAFIHGMPYGEDFPDDALTIIFSERRTTDIPDWIALYIALRILSREFTRPSDHQDTEFAVACDKVSQIFWRVAGL